MEAKQHELITTLDNHTKVNSSTMYRFQRRTLKSQRHLPFVELLVHTGGEQYTQPQHCAVLSIQIGCLSDRQQLLQQL